MEQSNLITTSNTALSENLLAKKDSLLNLPLQTVAVDLAKGSDSSSIFISSMEMLRREQEIKGKYPKEAGIMLKKDILLSFNIPIEVRAITVGDNVEAQICPQDGYTIEYYEDPMRNGIVYKWKRI